MTDIPSLPKTRVTNGVNGILVRLLDILAQQMVQLLGYHYFEKVKLL